MKSNICSKDKLFIWGIILSPFTALRIWKFGPGEILLILWMLWVMARSAVQNEGVRLKLNIINRYQIANLCMMFIGMVVCVGLYNEAETIKGILTDFLSHFFMLLLTSCILLYYQNRDIKEINAVISRVVSWGAVVHGGLLVYASCVSRTLFGRKLWLAYRFQGLALNPHQIAMITGSGVFFSLYLASITQKMDAKIRYIVISAIWFVVSLATMSDIVFLVYLASAVIWLFLKISKLSSVPSIRLKYGMVLALLLVLIAAFAVPALYYPFMNFVNGRSGGSAYLNIWASAITKFKDAPIKLLTGMGPGAHTGIFMLSGSEAEAHNTYLQLVLDSGIVICIYYIIMALNIIKYPLFKNSYVVLSVLYFMLSGISGNMSRRVLAWFTYTMAWLIFEKTRETETGRI